MNIGSVSYTAKYASFRPNRIEHYMHNRNVCFIFYTEAININNY